MPNTPTRCRICKQHPAECKCEYDEKGLCQVCGQPKQAHYRSIEETRADQQAITDVMRKCAEMRNELLRRDK